MRIALDTHSLIWAMDEPTKLSVSAASAIQDPINDLSISAVTVWEIAIKVGNKKLALSYPYRQWMEKALEALDLTILPITLEYAERQSTLPPHHKDPFDRLLIAQALVEGIPIVSITWFSIPMV